MRKETRGAMNGCGQTKTPTRLQHGQKLNLESQSPIGYYRNQVSRSSVEILTLPRLFMQLSFFTKYLIIDWQLTLAQALTTFSHVVFNIIKSIKPSHFYVSGSDNIVDTGVAVFHWQVFARLLRLGLWNHTCPTGDLV